jgi:hypothetical protein
MVKKVQWDFSLISLHTTTGYDRMFEKDLNTYVEMHIH